jgi:O-antigen/teichoic acid export membrane protein
MTESRDDIDTEHASGAGRRVWTIGLASAAAAVLTWILQVVAGRLLGPQGFAAFMVVWGFVFLEVGLLMGLQQETTRAAKLMEGTTPTDRRGTPLLRLGLAVGGGGALLLLVTSPAWGARLFGADWLPVVGATAFGFLAYATYNVVNGTLAAAGSWGDYALSITAEGVLRGVLVLGVLLVGGGLAGQTWALSTAGLTWALLCIRSSFRASARSRVPVSMKRLTSNSLHAMVATGCSAIMIAGFPVLLKVTASQPLPPEAGVLLAAIVVTRAPLLLPLSAFSAVVLTRFVVAGERIMTMLARLCVPVALVTAAGALAAYVVGPYLLRLLYGQDFEVSASLISLLVVAAGLLTMQSLSGSAVLASGRHRLYAAGWLLATAVSVLALISDLTVETRSLLALLIGPVVGLLVNVLALWWTSRRSTF